MTGPKTAPWQAMAERSAAVSRENAKDLDMRGLERAPVRDIDELALDDPGELLADVRQRRRRVRTLDFSQPTKFTAELRRRIVRVLGPFSEALANRLSAELRVPVELRLADSSQLTWAAARAELPSDSISVALQARPIDRQMLLSIELGLIHRALECLLGGEAAEAPATRRLTEIDWALTRRLFDSIVLALSLAWRDLGGLELALREMDLEGDAGVFAPIGEPTFSVTLEVKIDGLRSTMSLLIPWTAIEPVEDEILGTVNQRSKASPQEGSAVQRSLAGAEVLLRAEIGSAQMPVERVLALHPGTLLRLGDRAENGVLLYAEGVTLGHGRPGRMGARRAVKLTSRMEPAAGSGLRTTFGRGEDSRAPARAEPRQTLEGLAIMRNIPMRVWAELGRTSIALGRALELPRGTVVELDQEAAAPIELFVNGLCFAHGELLVTDDGEWAVRVDSLV